MTHEYFTRESHYGRRGYGVNLISLAALFLALIGVVFAILAVTLSEVNPLVVLPPTALGVVAILRLRS